MIHYRCGAAFLKVLCQVRGLGTEVLQWDPGAKPPVEVWGQSPPEAEAFL